MERSGDSIKNTAEKPQWSPNKMENLSLLQDTKSIIEAVGQTGVPVFEIIMLIGAVAEAASGDIEGAIIYSSGFVGVPAALAGTIYYLNHKIRRLEAE